MDVLPTAAAGEALKQAPESVWARRARWLVPLLIAAATFLAFLPALKAGFVNWDDDPFLTTNMAFRGLGARNIFWAFTTNLTSSYQPVTWLFFELDYALWGMKPAGYHCVSLIFHALNAVLLYLIALRLLEKAAPASSRGRMPAATLAALLFSLHPLRVESVAWAFEFKGVLSGFFYLLTVWSYLKAAEDERPSRGAWLLAAQVSFALGLLAKATGITLPVVLLALDIYPLRRLDLARAWRDPRGEQALRDTLPFFLMAFAISLLGMALRKRYSLIMGYDVFERVAGAFYQPGFYLWKTLVPTGICPQYGYGDVNLWPLTPGAVGNWSLCLLTAAVTAAALALRRRAPALLCAWLCYLALLLPTLGLVRTGSPMAADRYTYLACGGLTLCAAGAWQTAYERFGRRAIAAAAVILAALAGRTWWQTSLWHDSKTLWDYTLSIYPDDPLANNNLGTLLYQQDKLDQAEDYYKIALRTAPYYELALFNMANLRADQNRRKEAVTLFRRTLTVNPDNDDAGYRLAVNLSLLGRYDEAVAQYQASLAKDPDDYVTLNNLANALGELGKTQEAITTYERALELDPDSVQAHVNLGQLLLKHGQVDLAIGQFQAALRLKPAFKQAADLLRQAQARKASRSHGRG